MANFEEQTSDKIDFDSLRERELDEVRAQKSLQSLLTCQVEEELLDSIEQGSNNDKNLLIESYQSYLRQIAKKIRKKYGVRLPLEDLIQAGKIGILRAIDRVINSNNRGRFRLIVLSYIRHEMVLAINDNNGFNLEYLKSIPRFMECQDKLYSLLGREPSYAELAAELNRLNKINIIANETQVKGRSPYSFMVERALLQKKRAADLEKQARLNLQSKNPCPKETGAEISRILREELERGATKELSSHHETSDINESESEPERYTAQKIERIIRCRQFLDKNIFTDTKSLRHYTDPGNMTGEIPRNKGEILTANKITFIQDITREAYTADKSVNNRTDIQRRIDIITTNIENGETCEETAARHGISSQRVCQIVDSVADQIASFINK